MSNDKQVVTDYGIDASGSVQMGKVNNETGKQFYPAYEVSYWIVVANGEKTGEFNIDLQIFVLSHMSDPIVEVRFEDLFPKDQFDQIFASVQSMLYLLNDPSAVLTFIPGCLANYIAKNGKIDLICSGDDYKARLEFPDYQCEASLTKKRWVEVFVSPTE